MKGRLLFSAAAAGVFAWIVFRADPFLLFVLGVAPLVWVGVPASVLAAILWLVAVRRGSSPRPALTILLLVGLFGGLVGLGIPANWMVQRRAVAAAKAYPEQVAPMLEDHRRRHGEYPPGLDGLSEKPAVPRLLRSSYGYRSDGVRYWFCFRQPGSLIDCWDWDSETRKWSLST